MASPGVAESFLKVAHVKRTGHAHQVTTCSLHILQQVAFSEYEGELSFNEWCEEQIKSIPQFHYWHIVLQLELLALVYVSSLRVGNFPLYISSLEKIAQWCFALDHTNYARWLPIHINDMLTLESRHPSVYQEFNKGNFVVFKSKKKFSAMAIDQAHEQNNALVKGNGGAVGLTESPNALLRWMVAGPDTARVIQEFQSGSTKTQKTTDSSFQHHEMSRSAHLSFDKEVKDLVGVFSELGNPFLEKSEDILVLDTKTIADPGMLDKLKRWEKLNTKIL